MDKGILKAVWAGMFLLCAVLGFVSDPTGFDYWMMVSISVLFFVPPALLLYRSWKDRDEKQLRLIFRLSLLSLVGTAVLLIANFFSVLGSDTLGKILYWILVIFSTPMVCCQNWALSLFAWAVLMMSALSLKKSLKS